ncbi:MAG TPA: sensor histidine kinase [Gemmatimonadaceae bacterium]|nr:sensor histidine kinase [Gemmatimonadaceae bacterium]
MLAAYATVRAMTNQDGSRRDGMNPRRTPVGGPERRGRRLPRWIQAALAVPLVGKIAGANAIIVLAALVVALAAAGSGEGELRFVLLLASALAVSLVVNAMLVLLALRPLVDLEATAQRIWRGDLTARVPHSLLAHPDLQRVGSALNVLLDGLASDRARLRALASEVIEAGDRERAHIARELHDSTAQTLAALMMELSVLARENEDARLRDRLDRVRRIASDVLDEVKLLAHTVHPRVLDDLGLAAALRLLAREAEDRSSARFQVEVGSGLDRLPASHASVLYRVAQEAANNALRHGQPQTVTFRAGVAGGVARLEVVDDGAGFDVEEAERERPGMGLFTMRERASLVGGALEIHSERRRGTRVIATVPTAPAAPVEAPARGDMNGGSGAPDR